MREGAGGGGGWGWRERWTTGVREGGAKGGGKGGHSDFSMVSMCLPF